ncbi:hypothetical protein [Clostridium sp.]|jgi:hypothetical protein|uniref:hypothetical protein n=1 Tax=Clostridium sp. TaxID=1506 RepID=UPI003EEA0D71
MKKIIFILMIIALISSLMFNRSQYKAINTYKVKQNNIDIEMFTRIGSLQLYLNNTDFQTIDYKQIKDSLSMSQEILTLAIHSTYSDNEDVVNCFSDLTQLFNVKSIDELERLGEQVNILLKSTTIVNKINPDGCKQLSKFIRIKW